MASLDGLPPDQRAVLQMVLGRGRGYDQIAEMLSIDRQGVRTRARAALDALGPGTGVPAERRSEITDYLLGQLDAGEALQVWDSLANTPSERAWARVVASELTPLASRPLPEIPVAAEQREPEPAEIEAEPEPVVEPVGAGRGPRMAGSSPAAAEPSSPSRRVEPSPAELAATERPAPPRASPDGADGGAGPASPRRGVSRLGGAILLGGVGVIVVVVVVILLVSGGSGAKHHATAAKGAAAPASKSASSSTTPASTTATPVAQINLLSPSGSKSTAGIAEVLRQGSTTAVAIVAQGLAANTKHDAYAVWLYNSAADAHRLGFVNPGVSKNGRLETTGPLPSNASSFKEILISLETSANPKSPGHIVLQGALNGV